MLGEVNRCFTDTIKQLDQILLTLCVPRMTNISFLPAISVHSHDESYMRINKMNHKREIAMIIYQLISTLFFNEMCGNRSGKYWGLND